MKRSIDLFHPGKHICGVPSDHQKIKKLQMKQYNHLPQIQSVIDNSGFVAMKSPSVDYPIPVALSYRTNPDGSLRWLFPEGSNCPDFSRFYLAGKDKKPGRLNRILFTLGLGKLISHGRTIMYTDLPTATFIQTQWRRN